MLKRSWIIGLAVLLLAVFLSACGSNELAEELTPIPTLPPGEEPELVAELQAAPTQDQAAPENGQTPQEPDLALGEQLFGQNGCAGCHGAEDGVGPALTGMADRAVTHAQEGQTPEEYLHESIVDPCAYVVDGYQCIMQPYDFSDHELNSLVAWLMTHGAEGGAEPTAEPEQAEPTTEPTQEPAEEPTEAPEPTAAPPTEAPTEEPAAAGDPANGEAVFNQNGCAGCHGAEDGVGPALTGMGERASQHAQGDQTPAEYLHESVVDPCAYVVDGYQCLMQPYDLPEQELNDLVAYLLQQ